MSPQQTLDELDSRHVMTSPPNSMSVLVTAPVPGPEHSVASGKVPEELNLTASHAVHRIILHLTKLFIIEFSFLFGFQTSELNLANNNKLSDLTCFAMKSRFDKLEMTTEINSLLTTATPSAVDGDGGNAPPPPFGGLTL